MKTRWMRILSLCLVAVILCGMVPNVSAAEIDTEPASTTDPTEETATIETESTEPAASEDGTGPDPTEATDDVIEPTADSDSVLPLEDEEVLDLLTSNGFALTRDSNPDGYVYKNGLIWTSDPSKEFDVVFQGVTRHVEKLSTYAVKYNGT